MHVRVNGTRLWFDVDGPALVPDGTGMRLRPTILMLHGGPGSYDHSYFKPDFARLAGEAQVVYLDQREHGRSARDDAADWSFEVVADDLRAFCDTIGIVKPVVYGHSLGGFVAMVYATRHRGHAGALVLQSTTARFNLARVVDGFRRAGGEQIAEIAKRFYSGDLSVTEEFRARCRPLFGRWVPGEQERARTIVNPELLAPGLKRMRRFDVLDQLALIDCPTLVSVGDRDPITQLADAREIAAALPEGSAQLEVIEEAGHFPWKDAPDRYWPMISRFLKTAVQQSGVR
jgi:proline iminopeptidase